MTGGSAGGVGGYSTLSVCVGRAAHIFSGVSVRQVPDLVRTLPARTGPARGYARKSFRRRRTPPLEQLLLRVRWRTADQFVPLGCREGLGLPVLELPAAAGAPPGEADVDVLRQER